MRGEFDRLVMAPTARELDAALAEIRVRAVPIARRRARERRQLAVLGFLALAVGGAAVGRATAPGLRTTPDEGAAVLRGAAAPWSAVEPAREGAVTGSVERYHVAVWTEWDGERYAESQGWVEGPRGVGFRVNAGTFSADVRPDAQPEVTVYHVSLTRRRTLGRTREGEQIEGVGRARLDLPVRPGGSLVMSPNGRPRASQPTTFVRITGPAAAEPEPPVRWRVPDPGRARGYGPNVDLADEWSAARRAGVRYANAGHSASILPLMTWQPFRVLLRAPGAEPVELEVSRWQRSGIRIPGVSDTMAIVATWLNEDPCVLLLRRRDRTWWQGHDGNRACFAAADPYDAVSINGPRGERLTVRMLP